MHAPQTLGAVHGLGGDLSALPFQSRRNATEEQLKCFQGGLGQATDTYNVRHCGSSNAWHGVPGFGVV